MGVYTGADKLIRKQFLVMDTLNKRIDALMSRTNEGEAENQKLKQENKGLEKNHEYDIEKLNHRLGDLRDEYNGQTLCMEAAEREIRELKQKLEKQETSGWFVTIKDLEDKNRRQKQVIDGLMKIQGENQSHIHNQCKQIAELKSAIEPLKMRADGLYEELKTLRNKEDDYVMLRLGVYNKLCSDAHKFDGLKQAFDKQLVAYNKLHHQHEASVKICESLSNIIWGGKV